RPVAISNREATIQLEAEHDADRIRRDHRERVADDRVAGQAERDELSTRDRRECRDAARSEEASVSAEAHRPRTANAVPSLPRLSRPRHDDVSGPYTGVNVSVRRDRSPCRPPLLRRMQW